MVTFIVQIIQEPHKVNMTNAQAKLKNDRSITKAFAANETWTCASLIRQQWFSFLNHWTLLILNLVVRLSTEKDPRWREVYSCT